MDNCTVVKQGKNYHRNIGEYVLKIYANDFKISLPETTSIRETVGYQIGLQVASHQRQHECQSMKNISLITLAMNCSNTNIALLLSHYIESFQVVIVNQYLFQ